MQHCQIDIPNGYHPSPLSIALLLLYPLFQKCAIPLPARRKEYCMQIRVNEFNVALYFQNFENIFIFHIFANFFLNHFFYQKFHIPLFTTVPHPFLATLPILMTFLYPPICESPIPSLTEGKGEEGGNYDTSSPSRFLFISWSLHNSNHP